MSPKSLTMLRYHTRTRIPRSNRATRVRPRQSFRPAAESITYKVTMERI